MDRHIFISFPTELHSALMSVVFCKNPNVFVYPIICWFYLESHCLFPIENQNVPDISNLLHSCPISRLHDLRGNLTKPKRMRCYIYLAMLVTVRRNPCFCFRQREMRPFQNNGLNDGTMHLYSMDINGRYRSLEDGWYLNFRSRNCDSDIQGSLDDSRQEDSLIMLWKENGSRD